jgi:hypothetical protein
MSDEVVIKKRNERKENKKKLSRKVRGRIEQQSLTKTAFKSGPG